MLDTVVILAGGLGTRLKSVLPDTPKCLAPINDTPFIGLLISFLKKQGINNFIFSLGYKSDLVIEYLECNFKNINIHYSVEKEQLGTGGAIKLALTKVDAEEVLVVNGDTFFNNDLKSFYKFHKLNKSNFTIALTKVENGERFGSVVLNDQKEVVGFSEKNESKSVSFLINAGQYILNKEDFLSHKTGDKFSIELDFFQNNKIQKKLNGYEFTSEFIDIGIPDDLKRAQTFFNKN
jgi:D-glycero-alpha-D-manno-heptose 1-phosphate guanylyltransferase